MLGIFAHSFMTATRTGCISVHPVRPAKPARKSRWLPSGHWWKEPARCIDPNRI